MKLRWTCDERDPNPGHCRNPHGCHCREITSLIEARDALTAERDHIARNRDMWKGQCEHQAERLSDLQWQHIHTAPKDSTDLLLWGACFPPPDGPRYAKGAHVGWWDADVDRWVTRSEGLICDAILWMPISRPQLLPDSTDSVSSHVRATGE